MNGASIVLAKYVRDLLTLAEGTVVILGRTNKKRGNTTSLQVAIDMIAPATSLTDTQDYDGTLENMNIAQLWSAPMTIDFFGSTAYNEAVRFTLLNRSQAGYELRQTLGIDVGTVSSIQDLKLLTGEQYSERYQVEVNLTYTLSADVPTLRVDQAVIDPLLTN